MWILNFNMPLAWFANRVDGSGGKLRNLHYDLFDAYKDWVTIMEEIIASLQGIVENLMLKLCNNEYTEGHTQAYDKIEGMLSLIEFEELNFYASSNLIK